MKGAHEGVLRVNIKVTGKQASWTGIDILEIQAGKIIGRWSERNIFGHMQQLGALDLPPDKKQEPRSRSRRAEPPS